MPDGDYLAWHAGGKWRVVTNLMQSRAPLPEIQDAMASATAKTLRDSHGAPKFYTEVERLIHGTPAIPRQRVLGTPSESVISNLLTRLTDSLAASMQRSMQLTSPETAARQLAEIFLRNIAASGIEHALPELTSGGHLSAIEIQDLIRSWSGSGPFGRLVDRFLKDPKSSHLRTPNRLTPRKSTEDLMDLDIGV